MSEIAELLERFRRGGEVLAVATLGAAGPQLDFSPAPGKWTVRQIVCHLLDSELVACMRFRSVIAEDNPTLPAYDQDAWATNLHYEQRKLSPTMELFRKLRKTNYELLHDLPEEAFRRPAIHSETGPLTLLDLVKSYASHVENHARQIQEVRRFYKASR